uniref:ferroxidase n=1 Tax=Astyanax mexicanus TaxID=7994 RepID=A0A8B9JHN5_ASTMX
MSGARLYALLICLAALLSLSHSRTRTYHIGIREEEWDYAPGGKNFISGLDISEDQYASVFLEHSETRIGSKYKKAVYRQYTNEQFTTEIPKPEWLGFLGPVIRAEVGDDIEVHMKNFASRPYSIHPHGVFYEKDSEGALYPDGTSGQNKADDAVAPGQSYTYKWKVKEEFAPMESDSTCLTWIYHSHVDAPKDIAAGLVGVLLTCKKGTLDSSGLKRSDVDQEFFLMFSVVDENLSWYLNDNINKSCNATERAFLEEDDFHESNLMHSINGYVYGNLPTLSVCIGKPVSWHLFGIGSEVDIHSVHFHGHTLLDRGHRSDVLSLFPASFVTAEMVPKTPGKWMLSCQVNDHTRAGMQAFYQVSHCQNLSSTTVSSGHERHYHIAAEEQMWDYAPTGKDIYYLTLNKPDKFFTKEGGKLGGKYLKARYVLYADDTFTTKMLPHGSEQHLGILGPVIRAETGDVIVVTFKNKAQHNYSMQPHGLHYDKAYEGAMYQDGSQKRGASVAPGQTFTYRWHVMEGPSPSDPPCLSYLYYSATDLVRDTSSGLVGPIQVCKKGVLDESGRQHLGSEVQKEFFLLFTVFDENESWYLHDNIARFGSSKTDPEDEGFMESNKMHSVNGLMYGNLHGLDLCEGDHVVWHTLGLGTEVDLHGVHFQGNTFQRDGTTRDTLSLLPHTSVTVSMIPNNDGVFELSCLTTDHHRGGMRQKYTVKQCSPSPVSKAVNTKIDRTYYLAAEEVEWNYAPNRTWELEKHNTTEEDSLGKVFLGKSDHQIGPVYKKVVFRQYTDKTFTTKKRRSPEEEHLGILGPILRAEVGEVVQVVFKNKAKQRWYSVHAHGVKTSEAHLKPVSPGEEISYNWTISAGPGFIMFLILYCADLGINGKLYANLHGLDMDKGDRTEWYLIGLGNEMDMHTVHFHAQSFVYRTDHSHRADVYDLLPGTFQTVELVAGTPGTWLLHCHVTEHIHAGMETTFTIHGQQRSLFQKSCPGLLY